MNGRVRHAGRRSRIRPKRDLTLWVVIDRCFASSPARAFHVVAGQELRRQFEVRLGAAGTGIVKGDWLAMAGRLRQADVSRDHGPEENLAKVLAERLGDLLSEVGVR